jgi:hypothetical protein
VALAFVDGDRRMSLVRVKDGKRIAPISYKRPHVDQEHVVGKTNQYGLEAAVFVAEREVVRKTVVSYNRRRAGDNSAVGGVD